MKMNWNEYMGKTLNIILHENYGVTEDPSSNTPFYEIVFKTGKLFSVFEDGLLLETEREKHHVKIFIPYNSIKCAEIFNI
ncbi:MAG: hypothetical protein ACM34M_08150 [Ignavibacteria bacterium]